MTWLARLAVLFLLFASSTERTPAADERTSDTRWDEIEGWEGTFELKNESRVKAPFTTHTVEARGTMRLVAPDPTVGGSTRGWRGTWTGLVKVRGRQELGVAGTGTIEGEGHVTEEASLHLDAERGVYYVNIGNPTMNLTRSFRGLTGSATDVVTETMRLHEPSSDHALPASGTELKGQLSEDLGSQGQWITHFRWHLRPTGAGVDLVVQLDGYEEWLPRGGLDETMSGNEITAHAKLVKPDGTPSEVKARKILFELLEVSREPGVAMNFPQQPEQAGPEPDFDLKFRTQRNPRLVVPLPDKGQRAETLEGGHAEAAAVISAYDFGAYGTLRVSAELTDGRTIVGHLADQKNTNIILLPRRKFGSLVAQAWKEQSKAGDDLSDGSDEEREPIGDKNCPGDGLSLYEEYRGFIQNRGHFRADPTRRDFFIIDQVGAAAKGGFELFARLTGMRVRHEFLDDEIPHSRVINTNTSGRHPDLHRVDQHAILVFKTRDFHDAVAVPLGGSDHGPGVPRMFWGVAVGTGFSSVARATYDVMIAHELLHTSSVWHHGEGDEWRLWEVTDRGDGTRRVVEFATVPFNHPRFGILWLKPEKGPGCPVTIRDEKTETPIDFAPGEYPVWVGRQQGQHSGKEDCVMRYVVATAYVSVRDANTRYRVEPETAGRLLCDVARGTTVNKPGPKSRYGDAARGACQTQLCVNDAITPPKRDIGDRKLPACK